MKLTDSVGSGAENRFNDVVVVQTLLNQNIASLTPHLPIDVDGKCGPNTIELIAEFQC
ncbi:peptidoglycan-binding domain-containing protein [Microbulbifer sp. SA54]|uniref:peptidoglycan-binding domain-containing protein n=1 Tax=Microbulbifer sp. SA54 TaxID=3401577 RepID=UPI003AAC7B02